jgi:hypothetical protein
MLRAASYPPPAPPSPRVIHQLIYLFFFLFILFIYPECVMSLDWHPLPPPVPLGHWGPLEPTSITDINYRTPQRRVHLRFAGSGFRYCPLNKILNACSVCTRIFSPSLKKTKKNRSFYRYRHQSNTDVNIFQ